MLNKIIKYFLHNRVITLLLLGVVIIWGLVTAPFNWHQNILPSDPVPVDAIPDIGENQQIVATEWMGRSPKDIQEQITYPLTTSLLGIPGVKTVRSSSMFGMSFIYIIFEENVEFYWSRSRILEKLNSLPAGTLPEGVIPSLGPDATALGQVYWYTLEGRNPETGEPTGGWDPDELRTIQDFYAKYSLSAAEGVSEVASIGGYVKEYQVEVNPDAMRAYNVSVMDVMSAIQKSNLDIGAETIEINKAEYLVRGLGYIKNVKDLEDAVVTVRQNVPVKIKDVAFVNLGPATRRGGLDKEGIDAVGGVVVARYGANPMHVINNVKDKIKEMEAGLPQKTLADGTISKVTVVPFYDRSGLIQETIGTLETALAHEILICIIVVIVLVINLRASVIISSILPIGVLATFIIMRYMGIEANIVALSGIAIAIGVMVDVGVVFVESILRYMEEEKEKGIQSKGMAFVNLITKAVSEVSGALSTAMLTTIISFLPVFAMEAQEGKLFKPLAYTKTFALLSAFILGIIVLPTIAYYVYSIKIDGKKMRKIANYILGVLGIGLWIYTGEFIAVTLTLVAVNNLFTPLWKGEKIANYINVTLTLFVALYYLTVEWLPLGTGQSTGLNFVFVFLAIGSILGVLWLLVIYYEQILRWALTHRWKFMSIPIITLLFGMLVWLGVDKSFGFVAKGFETVGWKSFRETAFWQKSTTTFPGIGQEFMPSLNEGSFLLMPTSMPHTGIEQNLKFIGTLDKRIQNIPEVEIIVGKWGRVNSALDPAPTQMFENTINYIPEYILNEDGHRERFKVNKNGEFELISGKTYNPKEGFRKVPKDSLITDKDGKFLRQWRPEIKKADDIWQEIVNVSHLPGLTSAPKLQPIEARLVMLSTGMRAPMGLKVSGPDLESIEAGGKALETALKDIPSIMPSTVFYDRAVGAPYIEIHLNRNNMARYGITVSDLQDVIGAAIGGMALTTTVEGRERFPVRLRYPRELRDNPDQLAKMLIPTATGAQIPLSEVADIEYAKGSQMIQSENTFLLGYVIFDKIEGKAEVDVVHEADKLLQAKLASGELTLPKGVTYKFAGNYEQQERASQRLLYVVPMSLLAILLILYFQFKTIAASLIHFSGVFVAFAGGFILLWLYGQPWFMNFSIGDMNMRDLFQMHNINLSIAVWVGFIALFGLATNDGVLMGTYIHDTFEARDPKTKEEIREAVVYAGLKRVRPAAMTTATALIALLPVMTSTGKGAEIMVPMAIPTFGGMLIQSMTMFVVPVFQCWWREWAIKKENSKKGNKEHETQNVELEVTSLKTTDNEQE
ncbi:Cu(I)/Ag(I) efflux system membrane protein CusA/SilA [Myroides marinus]|uniref:Cu(I)/Ag(I) efflux system membrane protein CusA/SilA n=1 Tax=Myroides marinus TaxID=703342 RepID=A0A1H6X5S0_9FLAO|nr:efflux RND transporter permease subunit [Myroides marinus]SEJ24503.1 Cu(I)/Ag(I) efflux system membrane protein CusA/SilA [Myroides marinus]